MIHFKNHFFPNSGYRLSLTLSNIATIGINTIQAIAPQITARRSHLKISCSKVASTTLPIHNPIMQTNTATKQNIEIKDLIIHLYLLLIALHF